ncbi:DUF1045 domain-containing protein [Prosthecomicrobium sp. N25]|uniref:DUF1045 domain-containing protein n=1 Tax=Prosthecomicrobium sp. N25 TaxID=3129254 RepID=UPI0030771A67
MTARYAIYFAPPPESALWHFGSAIIGYDAAAAREVVPIVPASWEPAAWRAATADPRRYGFHATLKAPFRLREGVTEQDLLDRFRIWSAGLGPVPSVQLVVRPIGDFVALVPASPNPALAGLADAAVDAFEPLRAPLTADEIARRRPDRLTGRQRDYLLRFGYPYVREEFRFHMTLTGAIGSRVDEVAAALADLHQRSCGEAEMPIDRIAIFSQPSDGEPFVIKAGVLAPVR